MIKAIVDYLNANSGIPFVRFGINELLSSPYGVVKTEKGVNGRGVRVIVHYNLAQQEELETKMREVVKLLEDKTVTSESGAINRLGRIVDYTDVSVVSDDQTISMEALFMMPSTTI